MIYIHQVPFKWHSLSRERNTSPGLVRARDCDGSACAQTQPLGELTQLLLRAQRVEARLRDNLAKQLQKHILRSALHVCLVIYFNATVVMNFISLLIYKPTS